jgi:hypothetical protein
VPARAAAAGAALAIALAGCGALSTPELGVGTVEGRLTGARAGAYVYPLGRPDLKARVTGERYAIDGVPAGPGALVLVDRDDPEVASTCTTRVVAVEVRGAERTRAADVDASTMVAAGEVLAVAQPASGAEAGPARFTIEGTDVEVVTTAGTALLGPLPPTDGSDPLAPAAWTVSIEMAGYRPARVEVVVLPAATMPVAAPLQLDPASAAPGCRSSGCREGLACGADGACYGCVDDGDCPGGAAGACDPTLHVCRGLPGAGAVCSACTSGADCASGACAMAAGAAAGYCTRACESGAECPAGLRCRRGDDGSRRCEPATTCAGYLAAFGESCARDDQCSADLADAACVDGAPRRAGYCTAPCATTVDCVVAGYVCEGIGGRKACVHPP